MTITLNGTTGITTPAVTNNGAYTGDGISFADGTPSNTLVTDTSGNVFVGGTSQNTANNPVYSSTTAKAWLNMATGATFTTRASFNVSSLTRVAAGTLRMNFTNAMTDNNYVTVLGARRTDGGGSANGDPNICVGVAGSGALSYSSAVTTSFVQIVVGVQGGSSGSDQGDVFAAVFR